MVKKIVIRELYEVIFYSNDGTEEHSLGLYTTVEEADEKWAEHLYHSQANLGMPTNEDDYTVVTKILMDDGRNKITPTTLNYYKLRFNNIAKGEYEFLDSIEVKQ